MFIGRACTWLLIVVSLPTTAAARGDDAFLLRHREALAQMASDRTVELRIPGPARPFRPREPIPIELVFDRASGLPPTIHEWPCEAWLGIELVFDRPDGVSLPLRPLCRNFAERPTPGVPGCSATDTYGPDGRPRPYAVPLTVNGPYRFDAPGPYRIYARVKHDVYGAEPHEYDVSNVVTLEVLARDPDWEGREALALEEALRRAAGTTTGDAVMADCGGVRSRTAQGDASAPDASDVVRRLRALATAEAGRVLARHYRRGNEPHAGPLDAPLWGLFGADNRAAVVDALTRELRDVDRRIDEWFVRDLAALDLARREPVGPDAHDAYLRLVERYGAVRAGALAGRPGRLEAQIEDELRAGSHRADVLLRGSLGAVLHRYPAETMRAFRALDPRQQVNLLGSSWRRFAHAAFRPLLRGLYAHSPDEGVRSIALRRWYALDPAAARRAMLRELARPAPRVTVATLALLPDAALPRLEALWVELVEHPASDSAVASAAERLSRYGTQVSAVRVARLWQSSFDQLPAAVDGPLLAFLARVDPGRAWPLLVEALMRRGVVPGAVAAHAWTPEIESAVVEALQHPSRHVVVSAAGALAEHGSSDVRPAIEAALERAHVATARQARFAPREWTDEDVEAALADALANARGWWLTPPERSHRHDACVGDRCRQALKSPPASLDPALGVYFLEPHRGDVLSRMWFEGLRVPTVDALVMKLRQLPHGTRVHWHDWGFFFPELEQWTEAERRTLFEDVRRRGRDVGVEIVRNRVLVRDPRAVSP